jgi:hypothetical protein
MSEIDHATWLLNQLSLTPEPIWVDSPLEVSSRPASLSLTALVHKHHISTTSAPAWENTRTTSNPPAPRRRVPGSRST